MNLSTSSEYVQDSILSKGELRISEIPISELIRENEELWQYSNLTESYSPDTTTYKLIEFDDQRS